MKCIRRFLIFLILHIVFNVCLTKQVINIERRYDQVSKTNREYFKLDNYTGLDETELSDNLIYLNTLVIVQESHFSSIPKKFFEVFPKATAVTISNCGIESLKQSDFSGATELILLNLNKNELRNLPNDVFVHLEKLIKLGLAHNFLEELHSATFGGLRSLEVLDLEGNMITQMSPDIFYSLTNLENLNLDGNKFKVIPRELFKFSAKLKNLSLRNCGISQISEYIFDPLVNLEVIALSENQIESITSDIFVNSPKLEQIYLNKCGMKDIGLNFFTKFNSLATVGISYNTLEKIYLPSISTLYAFKSNIKELYIHGTAEFLWISDNQLQTIHIDSLELTRTIDVENNLISDLEFLKTARSLRVLDLSENPIDSQKLTKDIFANMKYLDFLDLSKANLTDFVDQQVFSDLVSLTYLNISQNHINHLDIGLFTPLKKLESLHIHDNNLVSFDCESLRSSGVKARVKFCI